MAGEDMDDDDESGDWMERMERNIKEVPFSELEDAINEKFLELSDPKLSNEDVLSLLEEFDHELVLTDDTSIDLIRRIVPFERPEFFRYYMMQMFCRMAEEEGVTEIVNAMRRSGLYRKVEDTSNKPWRGAFGQIPRFDPTLLGMIQACLRPLVAPYSDRSELNGDPRLLEILRQVIPALRPGTGSKKAPPVAVSPENIHRCTAAALFVYAQRSSSFTQAIMEDNDESMRGMGKDQRLDKAMTEMLTFVYFLLLPIGLYDALIKGIISNNPLLHKVVGTNIYEVTPAGKMVEWISQ